MPPDRLPVLRADEAFRQLLALGRFLNSIRFCQLAMITWGREDTPGAQRQRSAVLFIAASLLHEGRQLIQRMGKHFRHLPAWSARLQRILADKTAEQLISSSIKPIRNQTAFHFKEELFVEPLNALDHDLLVLASGDGPQQGYVHYELSDLLAHHAFVGGPAPTAEEHLARFKDLVNRTVALMNDITLAGEALVNDYCTEQKLIAEVREPDGTWRAV